jgi:hypothetical protein
MQAAWLALRATQLASVHADHHPSRQLITDHSLQEFHPGRIGTGYFLDRHFSPYVAQFLFANAVLGIAFLWTGTTGVPALLGAFLVGLGFGAEVGDDRNHYQSRHGASAPLLFLAMRAVRRVNSTLRPLISGGLGG